MKRKRLWAENNAKMAGRSQTLGLMLMALPMMIVVTIFS